MQKIERLIPCSAFVLQTCALPNWSMDAKLEAIEGYATFLQRELELWMFVPCWKDGKLLSEPDVQCLRSGTCQCGEEQVSDCRDWKYEYRKAKERCLFSGWTFAMEDEDKIYLDGVLFGSDCQLIYDKEDDVIWIDSEHIKADLLHTIEDLDYADLPLTPTALKEIYGS